MSRTKSCVKIGRSSTAVATDAGDRRRAGRGESAGRMATPSRPSTSRRTTATGRRPHTCGEPECHRSSTMYPISSRPLRTCGRCGVLHRLAKTYSENLERDVRPILPLLVGFVDRLGVLLDALEDRVIPSEMCASCDGNDDLCTKSAAVRAGCHAPGDMPRTPGRQRPDAGPGSRSLPAAKVQRARSSGTSRPGSQGAAGRPVSDNHDDHMVDQTVGNSAEKKTLKRAGNRAGRKAIPPKAAPITRRASRARRVRPRHVGRPRARRRRRTRRPSRPSASLSREWSTTMNKRADRRADTQDMRSRPSGSTTEACRSGVRTLVQPLFASCEEAWNVWTR